MKARNCSITLCAFVAGLSISAAPGSAATITFSTDFGVTLTNITDFSQQTITLTNGVAQVDFRNKTGRPILDFHFVWEGDVNPYTRDGGPFFKYKEFNKTSADFYKQDLAVNPTVNGTGIDDNAKFRVKIEFPLAVTSVKYTPTTSGSPTPEPGTSLLMGAGVVLLGVGRLLKRRNKPRHQGL